ncbi:MAG: DUF1015 domain-containing protein [Clostridia bacterium]|nr:DUF1015 domain-containing protein [Clostridia bacterium]
MKENRTVFSSAEILLPAFHSDGEKMRRWATIACDQFTSQPEYWEKCRETVGDSPSTLGFIMPEAYLGTELEKAHKTEIMSNMKNFSKEDYCAVDGLVYLKRYLSRGVRRGLVGKIDLEDYSYVPGEECRVRPTEKTVVERIPPRVEIRKEASCELPHILVLCDDKAGVFDEAEALAAGEEPLYDFDLMLGGGHITGYGITGGKLSGLLEKIALNEEMNRGLPYAVGDGNHSLAAAKAHWEDIKKERGVDDGPARYVLCEITPLMSGAIEFEPIYRLIKNCSARDLKRSILENAEIAEGPDTVRFVSDSDDFSFRFSKQTHPLVLGTLQNFIDSYLEDGKGAVCDYIHGLDTVLELAKKPGSAALICGGIGKEDLFGYVEKNGVLPRKTFSMGHAESKRYYLEMRSIT